LQYIIPILIEDMGERRKARELAVQVIFSLDFGSDSPEETFELICKNFDVNQNIISFARELVLGVWDKIKEVDETIKQSSKNWRLERMARVDKSVLRLATYELLFRDDIPPKVSINEAVELAKEFGNDNSYGFINGILDNIYNSIIKKGDEDAKEI